MGLLEPITHKDEIERLTTEAQYMYENALKNFESQKETTTNKLEELGKVKINSWADGMDSFVVVFDSFANISLDKKIDTINANVSFIGLNEEPSQMLMNIHNASLTAGEVAKAGLATLGTGALIGIASYGGAMMFGTASTGTAIATLSGAAKTNATIAWFGGGSKAVGGHGIAGGKMILAGIVVAPILVVGTIIAGAKGKERLTEAKRIHAEAKEASEKLNIMTTGMKGIAAMSSNYSTFIKKFGKKFRPFINELNRIKDKYSSSQSGKIDFNLLSLAEQKTVHLSWLMAQVYYNVLSTSILTSQGEVALEAVQVLTTANDSFISIKKDTYKLSGDDAQVANLIWKPLAQRMMIINSIFMVLLIFTGYKLLAINLYEGILFFLDSLVALPIFFKFRKMPESKKYTWRIIRLVGSVIIAILLIVLFGGAS